MDKELLRVVIILIGVLVMIGMVLWNFFKSLRERNELDYNDDSEYDGATDEFYEEEDEFDVFPLDSFVDDDPLLSDRASKPAPEPMAVAPETPRPEAPRPIPSKERELPPLIEFSIVARDDLGFNGEMLFDAFERVGLEYGSVKVFERVDKNRLVDFAVASMVEPGTFPDRDLEQFFCPGIVFFMQPREVDKPLAVFEDFIATIDILAEELDGVVWDHQRQPLTLETIEQFRQALA